MSLLHTSLLIVIMIVPCIFGRMKLVTKRQGESTLRRTYPKTHLRIHEQPPQVVHYEEGDSKFLECMAGGSPPPFMYWLKNGKPIEPLNRDDSMAMKTLLVEDEDARDRSKLLHGATYSRLYLDCLSIRDEAEYTCVAQTAYHTRRATTQVTVSSVGKTCEDASTFGQSPRMVTWSSTALENQGQDVKFTCRAKGQPQPTISWFDNYNKPIKAGFGTRYTIYPNGDLLIRNLKWEDMGNYACVAENIYGDAKVEAFLYPALATTTQPPLESDS